MATKHSTTNTAVLERPGSPAQRTAWDLIYLDDIPLDQIDDDPANERPDVSAGLQELIDSMRATGLQEPVRVYLVGPTPSRYMLASGHRRVAAARALGWTSIAGIVEPEPTPGPTQAIARIASNLCRLDIDAISLARGIQQLLAAHPDLTQGKVGAMLGKSQSAIANALRLLALPDDVLQLIAAGKLSAGHGMELLRIDEPELAWDGRPSGKTAAALQSERAAWAAQGGQSVAEVRVQSLQWKTNQKAAHKREAENAAREAKHAAARAAGRDPVKEDRAKEQREADARNAAYQAGEDKRARRVEVARAVCREAVQADPLGAAIVGALRGVGYFDSKELAAWADVTDTAGVIARLQLQAEGAFKLVWEATQLAEYTTINVFADERWGLNRKIAEALRAADLVTEKEYVALCSPKKAGT